MTRATAAGRPVAGGPARARRLAAALAAAVLASTATASGAAATAAAATDAQTPEPFAAELERLRGQDQRVADVAFRLRTANTDLCPVRVAAAGWTLHNAPQYGPRLRQAAIAHFGLQGTAPSVLVTAAGGPAARAGLRRDDVITAVNGEALGRAPATDGPGDHGPLAADLARIDAALAAGPARLRVRSGGAEREIVLAPAQACAHETQVDPSNHLQASADGNRVFISTRLVDFAASGDELAFVLAHEYAHDFLGHRRELDRKGFARAILGNLGSAPWDLVRAEREADHLGVYLAARAGYDVAAAASFFERLGREVPAARLPQWGHPSTGSRIEAVRAAVSEIERKRAAGEALTPDAER